MWAANLEALRQLYLQTEAQLAAATRRAEAADALVTERTTVVEQLQMALHLRDTQLTAMTTERDDYRSKSRDLERELELERGQVVAVTAERDAAMSALRMNTGSKGSTTVMMSLDRWTLHLADVERYGTEQWRNGNAGREPQEFSEWRREQA